MATTTTTTRPGGMPDADLPDMRQPPARYNRELPRISAESASAEPPAARTFPDDEHPTTNDQHPTTNDEPAFTRGPARRPAPPVTDPLLQWATGLQTKERRIYAGWLVEAGKHDALDGAMEQAGFPFVTIKHGNGNLVTHWAIETANVFVIADGVQLIGEMKGTTERYGIAFGWRARDGRMQSQLRCRVFLKELLAIGLPDPLLLTLKGTVTGDLLAALTRQYAVLDAIDTIRKESGKPLLNPPFYACSIPLGPGEEVTRGSSGASKEITPMVARIPDPVTKAYVLDHWAKRPWVEAIESLVEGTIAWSVATSKLIAAGEEGQTTTVSEDVL
jgi:hypothetical protein